MVRSPDLRHHLQVNHLHVDLEFQDTGIESIHTVGVTTAVPTAYLFT